MRGSVATADGHDGHKDFQQLGMMMARALEKCIWILIYGGLLSSGLGGALMSRQEEVGAIIVACGLGAALLGVVGIFVRSRLAKKD